jgi:hypothetical protein
MYKPSRVLALSQVEVTFSICSDASKVIRRKSRSSFLNDPLTDCAMSTRDDADPQIATQTCFAASKSRRSFRWGYGFDLRLGEETILGVLLALSLSRSTGTADHSRSREDN